MVTYTTLLLIVAALTAAVFGFLAWAQRRARDDERDGRARVASAWEAVVMRRRDLRLAVAVDGTPTLHGRTRSAAYVLSLVEVGPDVAPYAEARARADALDLRLVVWPPGPRPDDVPELPHRVLTGDAQFDLVLEASSNDVAGASSRLDADVRGALLSLGNAGVTLTGGELRVTLRALDVEGLDDHAIDALQVVVEGLCGPARASVAKA